MLAGLTVLVVETEFIIALSIQGILEGLGATDVVLAGSAADATAKAHQWSGAAMAIVEVETSRPHLIDLAQQISQSGIPVLGISADSRMAMGVPALPGTPIVVKPLPDEELVAAILDRLGQNPLPDVT